MIFDTDVLIWVQRGSSKAVRLIDQAPERHISIQTLLELLQGAGSKKHIEYIQVFLHDLGFTVLPLTENIGHRALIYIEQYALSNGIRAGDAIIAATAAENNLVLVSGNIKHFRTIPDIKFKPFQP